jgi:hypothetical protein
VITNLRTQAAVRAIAIARAFQSVNRHEPAEDQDPLDAPNPDAQRSAPMRLLRRLLLDRRQRCLRGFDGLMHTEQGQ